MTDIVAKKQVSLFGVNIDVVTMDDAVERVSLWIRSKTKSCHYVVTPNVDHSIQLQRSQSLRDAYADASLVTADGWPVVLASRLLNRPLPQRVPGSDLVPALFDTASDRHPLRIFLLGAGPGIAEKAARKIEQQWPHVQIVGTYCPPLGFEHDEQENARIVRLVNTAEADCLVVGLGAPKQELWIQRHRGDLNIAAALCVGATIDFLAGEKRRSPKWMQRLGLEWFHRMASEPRRLAMRYVRGAWQFPQLVWREWRNVPTAPTA